MIMNNTNTKFSMAMMKRLVCPLQKTLDDFVSMGEFVVDSNSKKRVFIKAEEGAPVLYNITSPSFLYWQDAKETLFQLFRTCNIQLDTVDSDNIISALRSGLIFVIRADAFQLLDDQNNYLYNTHPIFKTYLKSLLFDSNWDCLLSVENNICYDKRFLILIRNIDDSSLRRLQVLFHDGSCRVGLKYLSDCDCILELIRSKGCYPDFVCSTS